MCEIAFFAPGTPRPWDSGERAWNWRNAIVCAARTARKAPGQDWPYPPGETTGLFEVTVTFWMRDNLEESDLDNLAKPLLDALFLSRNSQVVDAVFLTRDPQVAREDFEGALSVYDDDRVWDLKVSKRGVGQGTCCCWKSNVST